MMNIIIDGLMQIVVLIVLFFILYLIFGHAEILFILAKFFICAIIYATVWELSDIDTDKY